MIDRGRHDVLGVLVDAVDYEAAVARILAAARERRPLAVTALAVHGVMTGALDSAQRHRLNRFDLVTPDGQPVRWALNWLYGVALPDRVYGPTLTLNVCAQAEQQGLSIFLYGSRPSILATLAARLKARYPRLQIAGQRPSAFRTLTADEQRAIAAEITASGAQLVLVGLGCPRQEVWVYEHRALLAMPCLAVGAAFDFHAGLLPQAPPLVQQLGLEWAFRLLHEPRRLWRRYMLLNPLFLWWLVLQKLGWRRAAPAPAAPPPAVRYG